ncbi:MAG: hypothetical protein LBU53_03955 [Zoogloeaceae bacterium]|jgi:hypothetical protein|nr:hypothetical protein [Zoogloeaceae bacterium]
MKKLILVALVVAGAWWYFVGGRNLSEEHVRGFYRGLEVATLERKPENLCSLLADDFESTGTMAIGGQSRTDTQNKTRTCEAYRGLYESWEKLGEKMGGTLQLDSTYTIHSVAISPDNKTATVDISSSLDVAGSIMNIRSRSTDTLIRRNGKVLLLRSEGKGSIGSGS